ncbi:cerebellin-4-like [Mercenaria mercenaria]|uniref:cerebellin-4-like n=1 Tax=Mercenaria mercenaria TaxID=6596 RepID=UPI00234EFEBF|nr:cerebellin-4-like [Mercenaria mercenaria]
MKSQMTLMNAMNVDLRNMMENSNMKIENKTDIKLKEVREDIEEKSKHSLDKIREVQNTLTKTSSDLQSAKSGINNRLNNAESRLSSVSSKLTSLEREQESQEDNFDGQISRLSNRISKEEARKVAFSAKLETKRSHYGKCEKIIFDEVVYSHGGGYSSSTGIFTAPKSGTYLFTFNVQGGYNNTAHVGLIVRGSWTTAAIVQGGPKRTGGNAGIAYLSSGDKVWIQTYNQQKYYIWPGRTTFNGILID